MKIHVAVAVVEYIGLTLHGVGSSRAEAQSALYAVVHKWRRTGGDDPSVEEVTQYLLTNATLVPPFEIEVL